MAKNPSTKLAKHYNMLCEWKDYKREVKILRTIIKNHKQNKGTRLLEIACGTGKHIEHLQDSFSILATDISNEMLSVGKKNNPKIKFKQADMLKLNLQEKFDVILCLFGSIGYIKTYKNLNQTIAGFSSHLNKGGIIILESFFTNEYYTTNYLKKGLPGIAQHKSENCVITQQCTYTKRGMLASIDMHHMISEKNKPVDYIVEHHKMAMFEKNKILAIMKKHHLQTYFLPEGLTTGRDVYVGVKQ